jgi:hypothetical protein
VGPAGFAEHGIPTEVEAGGLSVRMVWQGRRGGAGASWLGLWRAPREIAHCSVFEPPPKTLPACLIECGIPFGPHGFVPAYCDMDALVQRWTNEYACLGYGPELYDDLNEFCAISGVRAVAL